MDQTVVKAEVGRKAGSRSSRRLRAEGRLPAVVYGMDKPPRPVSVSYAELRDVLSTEAGLNKVFTLEVDGTPETVICRSIQRDPIKRIAIHADFIRIDPKKPVVVMVPIVLVGDDSAIVDQGGLIEQARFELEIEVPADSIPVAIEADVTGLTLDDRIAVGDLNLPAGASTTISPEISIAAPVVSRAAALMDELEAEEAAEAAEGEEGEGGEAGDEAEATDDAGSDE
jgi:large subunit ribosomal protein L25